MREGPGWPGPERGILGPSAATCAEWTASQMNLELHPVLSRPLGVIGAGRVGRALSDGLREAGATVVGPARRGEVPRGCHAIVLCVPDAEIERAAATVLGSAPFVGHTSGATPLSALAPAGAAAFGLHPLQTFAPPPARTPLGGVGAAVAGATPQALEVAVSVARLLGLRPFEIDDDARAAYHASASIASNFLVTVEAAAEHVAGAAGLERGEARALLAPLVRGTVENWVALGPERALTGPVARGDEATVDTQRDAVEDRAPQLVPLFDELVRATRALAAAEVAG